jgi:hypothetical protein
VSRTVRLLASAALLACGPRQVAAGPEHCRPSTASPATAAVAGLVGDYRVRLVATSGPRRDSSTDGRLHLQPVTAGSGASAPRYALSGTSDLRLEEVGAPPADVASRDPVRPGVVVFELPARGGVAAAPRIMLRLGAEANRQDVIRIEGASTVLRVREVLDSGFVGDWTSFSPLPGAEGYFCAWREGVAE